MLRCRKLGLCTQKRSLPRVARSQSQGLASASPIVPQKSCPRKVCIHINEGSL